MGIPSACFSTYTAVLLVLAPFALYALYWRVKLSGSLVVKEDYERLLNGNLSAGIALFNVVTRQIEFHEKTGLHQLPFEAVQSLILEVRTSRKIHLWLGLGADQDPYHLSIVTNHDLKRAGINLHLVAETLAGAGDDFLVAFREHQWQRQLLGATFEYHLKRITAHDHDSGGG